MKTYCIHTDYEYIGEIRGELKGNGKFPDQWGIFWYGGRQLDKLPYHYWNDKDKIVIITEEDRNDFMENKI